MKKTLLLLILWITVITAFPKKSSATHYASADLTYACIGGNDYKFTLTFFYDCSSTVVMSNTETLTFSSTCGASYDVNLQLKSGYPQIVATTCPGVLTYCNGGTLYGLKKYVYEGQTTIAPCAAWTFYWDGCCRNTSNNLQGQPAWYLPATLNNVAAPCNSSPVFSEPPNLVACVGQPFVFNHGASDPDNDSLVYSLVAPLTAAASNVPYQGGYTFTNPVPATPALNVDPATGNITMTPTQTFIGAFAIKVEEWRRIGGVPVKIGSIIRDMQVNVVNICNNSVPTVAGINPSATQYNPNDSIYTYAVCYGDTVDFNIYPFDASTPAQNLTLSWNGGLPGGLWNVANNNTPNPIGHVFWIPPSSTISNTSYCFTVNVKDDACPYIGSQTRGFCVTVKGMVVELEPANDSLLCMGESYNIVAHGDTNVVNYYWYVDGNPATPINDSTFEINSTSLGAGTHIISCKVDDGTTTICPGNDNVTITVVPQPDPNTSLGPNIISCEGQTVTLNAGPGQLFDWLPLGQNTQTINVTTTGHYSVTVDGGSYTRCRDTGSIDVRFLDLPSINLGPDVCVTDPITLDAGYPGYDWAWSTGANTQTISVNSSGIYSVTVSEEAGHNCDDIDTIRVSLNPIPTLNIGTDTLMCSHNSMVLYAKDIDGYLDNPNYVYTYYWLPGQETSRSINIACLPAGMHEFKLAVTGCVVTDTIRNIETKLCEMNIPNVFTPNRDNHNDLFAIDGIEAYPNSKMEIFNRWGKKVFESNNYTNEKAWDGGNEAAGVYYYVFTVDYGTQSECMEMKNYHGTITIIK
jgi:gliding motility-associated-like protein